MWNCTACRYQRIRASPSIKDSFTVPCFLRTLSKFCHWFLYNIRRIIRKLSVFLCKSQSYNSSIFWLSYFNLFKIKKFNDCFISFIYLKYLKLNISNIKSRKRSCITFTKLFLEMQLKFIGKYMILYEYLSQLTIMNKMNANPIYLQQWMHFNNF